MATLADNETTIRFLHILAGIVWIGMLYFFNLVNLPLLKMQLKKPFEANMAEKATAHITIKTLFWFRWGALFTVLFGVILLYIEQANYKAALETGGIGAYPVYAIGMGGALALVMAFNVWFVIWPRQQKILANNKTAGATTDEAEKKRLADANAPLVKTAILASRMNTWFSVPMLWGMVFGAHGATFLTVNQWYFAVAVLGVILALMWSYSSTKAKPAT